MDYNIPIKFEGGYKLTIKSIDADGKRVELWLSKDGATVDVIMLGDKVQSTFEYPNMIHEDFEYIRSMKGFTSTFSI